MGGSEWKGRYRGKGVGGVMGNGDGETGKEGEIKVWEM